MMDDDDTDPNRLFKGCVVLIVLVVLSWLAIGLFVASVVWLVSGLAGWWAAR
jgi:hypothetical protein